jgi:hypothetical protein
LESFFNFLASLSLEEGIKYFILLCLILAVLPYYEIILKYAKQIVLRDNLEILYFKYSTAPYVFIGKDSDGKELYASNDSDNLLITNTILNFVWEVKGALYIDLLPVGKKLKGNSSSVIINSDIKKYTLVAHGFRGEKIESIIDFSNEVFYSLQTNPIASNQKIIRSFPSINSNKFHKNPILNFNLTKTRLTKLKNWSRTHLHKVETININTDFVVHTNSRRTNINNQIEKAKIMKSYTFSTKKYQSLN